MPSIADEDEEMSWQAEDPAPRIEMFEKAGSLHSSVFASQGSHGAREYNVEPDGQEEASNIAQDQADEEDQIMRDEAQNDEADEMQQEFEQEEEQYEEVAAAEEEEEEEEEQEDDIWAIEARRATPRSVKAKQQALRPMPFAGQRGKLPSPWRRGSTLPGAATSEATPGVEEFSMLSQLSRNDSVVIEKEAAQLAQVASAKKMDLSSFFSSPAELPDVQPFGLFNALNARRSDKKQAPQASRPSGRFSAHNTNDTRGEQTGQPAQDSPAAGAAVSRPQLKASLFRPQLTRDEEVRHVPQKDFTLETVEASICFHL